MEQQKLSMTEYVKATRADSLSANDGGGKLIPGM